MRAVPVRRSVAACRKRWRLPTSVAPLPGPIPPETRDFLNALNHGVLLVRHGICLWLNSAARALLGDQALAAEGQSVSRLFSLEFGTEHLLARVAETLARGQSLALEATLSPAPECATPVWLSVSALARRPDYQVWSIEDMRAQLAVQRALQATMQEMLGVLNTAVMGIVLLKHRRIDRCNRRMEELFGFAPGELTGQSTRVWYASDAQFAEVGESVYPDLGAGREAFRELEFQRRDGSRFWGRLAGRALDPSNPYAGSVWIIEDLTAEHLARQELELARKVFEVNSEAIMITDAEQRIVSVNAAFQAITGYTEHEVRGKDPRFMGSGRHPAAFFRQMWATIAEHGHWEGEIWDRRKDGSEYPKWLIIDVIRDHQGMPTHYVAVFSDITDRKASEERIRYLAQHDSLTGLPNRFTLAVHLEHALARLSRSCEGLALMFIDLDNFKQVNDSLGHHVGDQLLCEVARRISGSVRSSDIVARIGGDEFVVVLEGTEPGDASLVADKIIAALAEPCVVDPHALHTTPSIGISIFPVDGNDADTLMKNADTAMYHAKSAGRNNYQYYAAYMNETAALRMKLATRLRGALANQELSLHYQPQIALKTGRVAGVEALIRWHNAELGMVSPASFIPLAEEVGLIVPIGEWVLRTVCEDARRWQQAGLNFGRVSVNISPQQFRQRSFPERVEQILAETGLPPALLELEITESTVMETAESAVATLRRLKTLGLALAIDDFGTGYSSLSYLKRFPIDRLKIDRSFVADIETDPSDAAIASAIVALAHSIGLEVVAEGVETSGQADFLRQRGCDTVQGFLYCRPTPEPAVSGYFRARS